MHNQASSCYAFSSLKHGLEVSNVYRIGSPRLESDLHKITWIPIPTAFQATIRTVRQWDRTLPLSGTPVSSLSALQHPCSPFSPLRLYTLIELSGQFAPIPSSNLPRLTTIPREFVSPELSQILTKLPKFPGDYFIYLHWPNCCYENWIYSKKKISSTF